MMTHSRIEERHFLHNDSTNTPRLPKFQPLKKPERQISQGGTGGPTSAAIDTTPRHELTTATSESPTTTYADYKRKAMRRKSNERFQSDLAGRDNSPCTMPVRASINNKDTITTHIAPPRITAPSSVDQSDIDLFELEDQDRSTIIISSSSSGVPRSIIPKIGSNHSLSSLVSAITLDDVSVTPKTMITTTTNNNNKVHPNTTNIGKKKKIPDFKSMSPPTKPVRMLSNAAAAAKKKNHGPITTTATTNNNIINNNIISVSGSTRLSTVPSPRLQQQSSSVEFSTLLNNNISDIPFNNNNKRQQQEEEEVPNFKSMMPPSKPIRQRTVTKTDIQTIRSP